MSDPLISVLLPIRNAEAFLVEAFHSVSSQTLTDFEVIVVNDGSTDRSPAIAEEYACSDSRFKVVHQPPRGIAAALENARLRAKGRYLARMDGDDIAEPRRFELQAETLESEGLAACGGRVRYFPEQAVRGGAKRYESWINGLTTVDGAARDIFVECPIPHPTALFRTSDIAEVGGYQSRGWPEDYDLVLRLWISGRRFRNIDHDVLRWRDHPERESRTAASYRQDAFTRCKVSYLRRSLLRGHDGVIVWGAGPIGKSFASEFKRQDVDVVAFVDVNPRRIGKTILDVPVIAASGALEFRTALAVGAVAGLEARTEIRSTVAAQGWQDGRDFIAVA